MSVTESRENRDAIYADHAATAPLRPEALAAMEPYFHGKFGNPSARYRLGLEARRGVELSRRAIAECLGCDSTEIFFTSGGSEGNAWAVWTAAHAGGTVLTTPIEHHSVLRNCRGMARWGLKTDLLPVDNLGRVDPEAAERRLSQTAPALASVQWANNEVGTVQDMAAIAAACRERGVPFHSDGVQALGHVPVDLKNIDYFTASAHKFGGPKGAGFLFARRAARLAPLIRGGGQESGLRGGTENAAAIAGMAAALKAALAEIGEAGARARRMAAEFRSVLARACPDVRFNGPEDGLPGLVSVTVPGRRAEELVYRLDLAGVCASAGAACDSNGDPAPSHVLTAMGLPAGEAVCTLRLSFGAANREGDGAEAARRLLAILAGR